VTLLRVGLVLALAVAATVVANVVLLGVATGSSEPVGRLSPLAALTSPASPAVAPPPKPGPVVPPQHGEQRDHERDD
jgi:hypothetical protein